MFEIILTLAGIVLDVALIVALVKFLKEED